MLVSEAIAQLREAELKQLSVKDDKPTVISFINLGVLELYKRFELWDAEALITMVAGKSLYLLDGTDTDVTIDLSDKQLLIVEEAWDPDGERMTINDTEDSYGVATPKYNQIEIGPDAIVDGQQISIIFRAAPIDLLHERQTIDLAPQFHEALFHYVGYRGHGSVKGDLKSENNTHYMRFEKSCDEVDMQGLGSRDDMESYKFEKRGFV